MRSQFKRIGDYITQVKLKNTDGSISNLKGININKYFMPSVANINGTDLSKYRVVKKNQFAFNPMHVGRDKVLPISMLEDNEPIIISPAYVVFKVKDEEKLLPEYLMMWCRRSEFDRNAWFLTDNSIRGSFSWADFCDMRFPIPSIEKQREIVREYNVVNDRISLNEKLSQKLEDVAQTIYKQWFVDFEFPISKEYAEFIGRPELEGKPYKSSGGEMEYCEDLKGDIPIKWKYQSIQTLIDEELIEKNQDGNHGEIHPKSSEFVSFGIPFVMANDVNNGVVDLNACKFITKERAEKLRIGFAKTGDVLITHKATMGRVGIVPEVKDYIVLTPQVTYYRIKKSERLTKEFLYCLFSEQAFQKRFCSDGEQSTRSYLSITNQRKLKILLPTEDIIIKFSKSTCLLLEYKINIIQENSLLSNLKMLLHSKMSKAE